MSDRERSGSNWVVILVMLIAAIMIIHLVKKGIRCDKSGGVYASRIDVCLAPGTVIQ